MKSLALFMTFGGSLAVWRADGILQRELALYESHAKSGVDTILVSYGSSNELEIARNFPFLTVLCNRWNLHPRLYNSLMLSLHRRSLQGVDLVKTNQLMGAKQAVRAARLLNCPAVIRQGYGLVESKGFEHGQNRNAYRQALAYEATWLPRGDLYQFSSSGFAKDCRTRLGLAQEKCVIVPNFIVEDTWRPAFDNYDDSVGGAPFKLGFWGRLVEQKNLKSLFDAVAGLDVDLTIIGDGPLQKELEVKARKLKIRATFLGRLPHEAIRGHMASCHAFTLPSLYEGHPKALIEAMSFGMPIITVDSPGISDLARDRETAVVGQTTSNSLRESIQRMMTLSAEQRRALATRAQRLARDKYSVQAISRLEREAYDAVLASHRKT